MIWSISRSWWISKARGTRSWRHKRRFARWILRKSRRKWRRCAPGLPFRTRRTRHACRRMTCANLCIEMIDGLISVAGIVCAVQALRAARLLAAAVWLAGASAFTALWLYRLGTTQLAVIELAVGAGLVTVLFVFAISISGEEAFAGHSRVPKPLALGLVAVALALLALQFASGSGAARAAAPSAAGVSISNVFWNDRALDTLVQIVLIF